PGILRTAARPLHPSADSPKEPAPTQPPAVSACRRYPLAGWGAWQSRLNHGVAARRGSHPGQPTAALEGIG
ncbi:MAG: hypothetical protein ACM3KE_05275, partial [Hyphomicrobiales bacterium]